MPDVRPAFWERVPLDQMTRSEWEALCDGCGKCCLNKLEDEDGRVELTRVACRLFDDGTCQCKHYAIRHDFVPECIQLTYDEIPEHLYWLPQTCAYRLLYLGEPLPSWHPLRTGQRESVHDAGVSVLGMTVSEDDVHEDLWEDYLMEEPK